MGFSPSNLARYTENFRCVDRGVGYVLEMVTAKGTYTRESFEWKTGTYNAVILEALGEALARMKEKCEIHLHTQNKFLLNMIGSPTYVLWEESGFRNSKGKEIANADLWKVFAQAAEGHRITTEEGIHSYYRWMQEQMDRL